MSLDGHQRQQAARARQGQSRVAAAAVIAAGHGAHYGGRGSSAGSASTVLAPLTSAVGVDAAVGRQSRLAANFPQGLKRKSFFVAVFSPGLFPKSDIASPYYLAERAPPAGKRV